MENRNPRLHQNPSVDSQNPFYCPAVPPATYIKHLRQTILKQKHQTNNDTKSLFNVFARMFEHSDQYDSDVDFVYDSENDWIIGRHPRPRPQQAKMRRLALSPRGPVFKPLGGIILNRNQTITASEFSLFQHPRDMQSTTFQTRKRRREETFSDLLGPPKHAKSDSMGQDISFELEVKRERLCFDTSSSPTLFPTERSVKVGAEATSGAIVLQRIESLLPSLRIRNRFPGDTQNLDIQELVDFLADNGLITPGILDILRTSDLAVLSLAASLSDEGGLNICGQDMFKTFSKTDSFLSLTEISFSGSRLTDFDLVHIHHLPKLSGLYLNNTGIGNEAVFLLVPLKLSLARLSLANNPDVDSDCVSALLLLTGLTFLSVLGTSIKMDGLRKLAVAARQGRYNSIDIEIPSACEDYIDNLTKRYLLYPKPPFITDPVACAALTKAALEKNLLAHAEANPSIVASGTQQEMAERLADILSRRKMDLVVAQMLRG